MEDNDEVIISNTAFDVPVDNYEEFDQEIDSAKLGKKLIQKNTLKGIVRKFQFYSNNHLMLNIVKKKKSEQQKFQINLAWLCAEPVHIKIIVWRWLSGSLLSAAALGLVVLLTTNGTMSMQYSIVGSVLSLTASVIFLLIFIYHMRDEYVFKSQFGGAKIFLIENKKPEQSTFDSFYIQLQQSIEKAKVGISVSDRLVGELKMCRRLRDENIINDDAYTVARTAIFKHEQYKT